MTDPSGHVYVVSCTIVYLAVAENRTCLSNVKYVLLLELQKFKYIVMCYNLCLHVCAYLGL